MAGPIADIIPIPIPLLTNVSSIGDVFIAAGLGWFVFATLVRGKEDPQGGISLGRARRVVAETEHRPGAADRARRRPRPGPGAATAAAPGRASPRPPLRPARAGRAIRRFWLAQTISLFGDRLHQVALGVLVYALTELAAR